jgi:tetratricopeptide (TPR) repeat protein
MEFDRDNTKEGLTYYRKAVEIDPRALIGWKVLSEALQKLGMKEEAQKAHMKYKEIEERLKKENARLVG